MRLPHGLALWWWRLGATLLVVALAGCATPPPPPSPPPPQPEPVRPVRLGLALGGGAARGFAHVGVLLALEAAGLRPDLVVGTSAGSVVGALYAAGQRGSVLQQTALTMDESAIADWTLPMFNRGVLRGEALARYIADQVQHRTLEQLPLKLGVVATDLQTGQGVLFQRGDTATAVRASSAVPGVFAPVNIQGRDYVDGGLVAPVPVRHARQMGADVVLAVDISSPPQSDAGSDTLQILLQTFSIMIQSINHLELRQADVVVRPALAGVASTDFTVRAHAIEAGRLAMQAALPQLRKALADAARRH